MSLRSPANGSRTSGYLATPVAGKGPGVLVIQEWWGLVQHIKHVCDRFAAEGFTALAPDMYHGQTASEPDGAGKLFMALNIAQAEKDLRGAAQHLALHSSTAKIGAVGFCMGGGLSVWAAAVNPEIGATVSYYYVLPHGKPDFSNIKGPVLGHFGTNDDFIPVEDAKALEAELQEAGVDAVFEYYEGAGHAFSGEHNRIGTYDEGHAENAWGKTVDFFKKHLGKG